MPGRLVDLWTCRLYSEPMHNAPAPSTTWPVCAHCALPTTDPNAAPGHMAETDTRLFVAIDAETCERTNLHFACVAAWELAWIESGKDKS